MARPGFGRAKGKRGERKLATKLREAFPEFANDIRRGWQSRLGDDDPDICGLPGFWVESKHGKCPNPRAAFKQAIRDAKGRAIPIAVIQDDRTRNPFVVIGLNDFTSVLRSAYGLKEAMYAGENHQGRRWEVVPRDAKGGWIIRIYPHSGRSNPPTSDRRHVTRRVLSA